MHTYILYMYMISIGWYFSTSLALPCKVFSHIWDVYPMEDLNWKLVLLRFVWVLGQQPCWSPAMCLQAFSVFVWDRWGCNVLRHQTKGPKKPMPLRDFKTSFVWNQAGLHQRNHFSTYYDLGVHWKRPSNHPWCWEPKTNWWETSDGPKLWQMWQGCDNFPSESWGPVYITTYDGPWWFVWFLMDTDFRWNTIVAMVFCHAPHFIFYHIYIYIFIQVTGITGPHQIASESHWINWIFFRTGDITFFVDVYTTWGGSLRASVAVTVDQYPILSAAPSKIWGEKNGRIALVVTLGRPWFWGTPKFMFFL